MAETRMETAPEPEPETGTQEPGTEAPPEGTPPAETE